MRLERCFLLRHGKFLFDCSVEICEKSFIAFGDPRLVRCLVGSPLCAVVVVKLGAFPRSLVCEIPLLVVCNVFVVDAGAAAVCIALRDGIRRLWVAGDNKGFLRDFDGAVKQELTVAQKKAALQAQIDALG